MYAYHSEIVQSQYVDCRLCVYVKENPIKSHSKICIVGWKNQTKENEYTWESARDRWSIETRHIGKLKSIRASKNGNKKLIKWTMTRETYIGEVLSETRRSVGRFTWRLTS